MEDILSSCRATQKLYMPHVVVSFYELENMLYIALENIKHIQTVECIISEIYDLKGVQVWARWDRQWNLMYRR